MANRRPAALPVPPGRPAPPTRHDQHHADDDEDGEDDDDMSSRADDETGTDEASSREPSVKRGGQKPQPAPVSSSNPFANPFFKPKAAPEPVKKKHPMDTPEESKEQSSHANTEDDEDDEDEEDDDPETDESRSKQAPPAASAAAAAVKRPVPAPAPTTAPASSSLPPPNLARQTSAQLRRQQQEEESEEEDEDDEYEDEEEDDAYDDDLPVEDDAPRKKYKQPKLKFDLSTFSGTFDAGAFVSDLTRDLFDQQDPNDFDPAPFQTLFENTLQRLNSLRDETDGRIIQYANQCRRDEEIHKENLLGLQEQLSQVMSQFSRLDSRISSVAHTSVRIGHTLQTVDAAKRSNIQGQEIIAHFLAFNEGKLDKLPPIYLTTDPNELHRAAELIQLLSNISQDLRVKGTEKATELIAKTSNNIENQLIQRFDLASQRQSLSEMKVCAETLLNFRGKSIIKRYVFNVIEKLENYAAEKAKEEASSPTHRQRNASMEDNSMFLSTYLQKSEIMDDKSLVGSFRIRLLTFYRGVSLSLKDQVLIVSSVFPQPFLIIKAILERVFQDKIQGLIDSGLNDKRLSTEEYLRSLEFTHAHTVELVAGLQGVIRTMPGSNSSSGSSGSSAIPSGGVTSNPLGLPSAPSSAASASNAAASGEQVSMMNLMDQVSGIFSSYREAYFSKEMQLITQVCAKNIHDTLNIEAPLPKEIHQSDTDLFGRLKKNILQDQKQKWILLVLEYPLVDRLIQQCSLSLSRCDKLSDPLLLPEHTSTIFLYVAQAIFDTFLQPVLDVAFESLPPSEPKTEPDPFFYQVIGLVNLIVDKLTLHHQHWIVQRVATNPNTQVICETRLRELMVKIEQQVCAGLTRMLSSSLKYTTRLLSTKQKSSDYRPREDDSDAVLDGKPSAACESVCAFIKVQYESVVTSLEGKNLDKFLTIFGLKLHDVLVSHLQKFTISTMGAGLLARDMKQYQLMIGQFHLNPVLEKWTELRQLIDLFFVGPDYLKAVISDSSKLNKLDPAYLLSWIAMRADYSDSKRKLLTSLNLKEATPVAPPPPTTTATNDLLGAIGRERRTSSQEVRH